jgi:hypothetical protein
MAVPPHPPRFQGVSRYRPAASELMMVKRFGDIRA